MFEFVTWLTQWLLDHHVQTDPTCPNFPPYES